MAINIDYDLNIVVDIYPIHKTQVIVKFTGWFKFFLDIYDFKESELKRDWHMEERF